jgi:hypothetical protein
MAVRRCQAWSVQRFDTRRVGDAPGDGIGGVVVG